MPLVDFQKELIKAKKQRMSRRLVTTALLSHCVESLQHPGLLKVIKPMVGYKKLRDEWGVQNHIAKLLIPAGAEIVFVKTFNAASKLRTNAAAVEAIYKFSTHNIHSSTLRQEIVSGVIPVKTAFSTYQRNYEYWVDTKKHIKAVTDGMRFDDYAFTNNIHDGLFAVPDHPFSLNTMDCCTSGIHFFAHLKSALDY